jgi:prevent-host-death family protein
MDTVSVYDAKAHFSKLVERAESGRSTAIAKRGRVVAKIVPARSSRWDRTAVLDEAEAFRKSLRIKGRLDLRKLIEHRRR